MGEVVAFKKIPAPLKSLHCKQCNGYKFAALQDETTVKMQLWCVDCWTIDNSIELKDRNGR